MDRAGSGGPRAGRAAGDAGGEVPEHDAGERSGVLPHTRQQSDRTNLGTANYSSHPSVATLASLGAQAPVAMFLGAGALEPRNPPPPGVVARRDGARARGDVPGPQPQLHRGSGRGAQLLGPGGGGAEAGHGQGAGARGGDGRLGRAVGWRAAEPGQRLPGDGHAALAHRGGGHLGRGVQRGGRGHCSTRASRTSSGSRRRCSWRRRWCWERASS